MAVSLDIASLLGICYGLSEIALAILRRAQHSGATRADAGSLRLLWAVIITSLVLAYACPAAVPSWRLGPQGSWLTAGCIFFTLGLSLRWYAIVYLGKYFTVDVAIAADHRLIDSGPYRYIRHPSYSGALLAFLGIGLSLNNVLSIALVLLPISAAFWWRIRVEERALTRALGRVYADYVSRTKRLIPGLI